MRLLPEISIDWDITSLVCWIYAIQYIIPFHEKEEGVRCCFDVTEDDVPSTEIMFCQLYSSVMYTII